MSHFTELDDFLKTAGIGEPSVDFISGKDFGFKIPISMSSIAANPGLSAALGLGAAGLGFAGVGNALKGEGPGRTIGYKINKGMFGLLDRIRADEVLAENFTKELGASSAKQLVELTRDVVTKGYETMKDSLYASPIRKKIFDTLKSEDEILGQADNKKILEAYHTMAKFAPTLSTDKNAVKSFLRTAVSSPGGLDFMTIKQVAEAERALDRSRK